MKNTLLGKLHEREIAGLETRSRKYRRFYGDKSSIADLDIINELDGHSGCVNALSWSRSGGLLASGSDDQHLNIHTFQPHDDTRQFKLTTTVATGHTQNIFSVKFMPHSNDRTVITAAGDSEVRIFDLEYAGESTGASSASAFASEGRRRRRNHVYDGVRYLSDGDTNSRVYRSHSDRVKRIVTESSPHLFLTCSEDGEVRQWDLRQPSSAYPPARGGRYSSVSDFAVPPPLISYKRYQLDINSISCSPSQPHYIALGGAHLHAFLHDRRMAGRDKLREAGKPLSPSRNMTAEEEQLMNEATQCVRKFSPSGQKKMKSTQNGHITALKISDARPNEMIVSWSGDHIYSFDLVRSPDAAEYEPLAPLRSSDGKRVKESKDRKRKRQTNGSSTSLSQTGVARQSSRPRTETGDPAYLHIRYQNGQAENIPVAVEGGSEQQRSTANVLTAKEREAQRIAKATVNIRAALFSSTEEGKSAEAKYTSAVGHAASILFDIDDEIRNWGYPIDPEEDMVRIQQTLRSNRESARRFVQAAGTLSRVLGGKLQTAHAGQSLVASFTSVEPRGSELAPSPREHFGYDFLKAILLWLESGIGKLIEGFTRPEEMLPGVKAARRLPIPASDSSIEAIDEHLIPYLLLLAENRPVVNVEANKFELDESRNIFNSEKAAVLAFAAAVKIPFEDLSSAVVMAEGSGQIQAQDRQIALRYWGAKVGRGILLNAAEGVNFTFVDRAFGGLGKVVREVAAEEARLEPVAEGEDPPIEAVEVLNANGTAVAGRTADEMAADLREARQNIEEDVPMLEAAEATESTTLLEHAEQRRDQRATADEADEDDDNDDDEDEDMDNDSDDDDDERDDSSSEPDEEDGVPNTGIPRFLYASSFQRRRMREKVGADVPCSSFIKRYRGHCNVKTVKDVNYFGLDDEYIVSGSDDGNLFIWDRKTSELVNVLEGDGEVVNVIQGHPYETMMAVSGIDHTIKIFSPDARARETARLGRGITSHDSSEFSSLAFPSRLGRRRVSRRAEESQANASTTSEPVMPSTTAEQDDDDESYVAESGLASRRRMQDSYRIMNQNDMERQGGNQDAFLTVRDLHPLLLIMGRAFW